jgi:hypothetical protein
MLVAKNTIVDEMPNYDDLFSEKLQNQANLNFTFKLPQKTQKTRERRLKEDNFTNTAWSK